MRKYEYLPIGIFRCVQGSPAESPRQGVLATESVGYINLGPGMTGQCLDDLEGFERIWLIYPFHENHHWHPKVRPPRGSDTKRGVFATRSPYRPNGIGMSCVKLESVEKKRIRVSEHDLLNGTPIFDIKPYLPYADSFPQASAGWVDKLIEYRVSFDEDLLEKIYWLEKYLQYSLKDFLRNQLSFDPTYKKTKRVKALDAGFELAYKTWRFYFRIDGLDVIVTDLKSGYNQLELQSGDDKYGDKFIHREFHRIFVDSPQID